MFHRVTSVNPVEDMRIIVHFIDNTSKYYDVKPLIKQSPLFGELLVPDVFKQVRVDAGGYGVSWNDELDISCNELWERGQLLP